MRRVSRPDTPFPSPGGAGAPVGPPPGRDRVLGHRRSAVINTVEINAVAPVFISTVFSVGRPRSRKPVPHLNITTVVRFSVHPTPRTPIAAESSGSCWTRQGAVWRLCRVLALHRGKTPPRPHPVRLSRLYAANGERNGEPAPPEVSPEEPVGGGDEVGISRDTSSRRTARWRRGSCTGRPWRCSSSVRRWQSRRWKPRRW